MNVEMLRRIQEQITARPKQFDMYDWFTDGPDIPECGTAACIGGWAVTIANWDGEDKPKPSEGSDCLLSHKSLPEKRDPSFILGLTLDQNDLLFYVSNWPEDFRLRYRAAVAANGHALAAKVACERINHFIATEGRE